MVNAFVMIETGVGESEVLIEAIRGLDRVTEAHVVAGAYDIIAEVETSEVYDILQTASSELQSFDGVVDTKTYIALDE